MRSVARSIDVLIVVDTLAAASSGSLYNNAYFFDSNGYSGIVGNKTDFYTLCWPGDMITWWVRPLDPASDISIVAFTGDLVNRKVCAPWEMLVDGIAVWEGFVRYRGMPGNAGYSIKLEIDNKKMMLDAFLRFPCL